MPWNTQKPERGVLTGCVDSSSVPPARMVSSVLHRCTDTRRGCCILSRSMYHPVSIPPRPVAMPIPLLLKMRKKKRPRRPAMNREAGPLRGPVRRRARRAAVVRRVFLLCSRRRAPLHSRVRGVLQTRRENVTRKGRFRSGIRQNRSRATGPGPVAIRCAQRIHLEGSRRHRRPRAAAPGWRRPHSHSVQPATAGRRLGTGAGTDREVAVRGACRVRGGGRRTRRVSPSRSGSSDGRGTGKSNCSTRTGASMAPRWTGTRTRSSLESPREYEKNIRCLTNLTVNTPWVCIFP